MTDRAAEDRPGLERVHHHERLRVPWWWWPLGLGLGGLLAAEMHTGRPGVSDWIAFLVVLPLVVGLLTWMGRVTVAVRDGELWISDAHLPARFIADAEALDEAGRRTMLGPHGDPAAFVVLRPWIRSAVVVTLDDPDDPTPYWLVSTRDPHRLVGCLERLRGPR
ncbi:MAG TPA: DUF3093 domain-containing protein [Mycobacteriales bacterium]|nr:DUF3093 domain-containing protein [Mycobacteriales bacterium]